MEVEKYDEVAVMLMPSSGIAGAAPGADAFGRIFWSRRSMFVLVMSALGLWTLPIAIGYGLAWLF
jgi:hypothetical protein